MWAAGQALKDRAASIGKWALSLAIVIVAGSALSLAPKSTPLQPGAVVSYAEDQLGRPWRIVRKVGYETFEIRNGKVLVVAGANDISTYHGYGPEVTVEMAGVLWRDKVLEIQQARRSSKAHKRVSAALAD
jgi:hypothetical protein